MKISVKPLAAIIGGSIGVVGGIGAYLSHNIKKAHKLFYQNLHVAIYPTNPFDGIVSETNTLLIFANNAYLINKIANALIELGVSKKNIHIIDRENIATEDTEETEDIEEVNYDDIIFFALIVDDTVHDKFSWFYKDFKKSIKKEMKKA